MQFQFTKQLAIKLFSLVTSAALVFAPLAVFAQLGSPETVPAAEVQLGVSLLHPFGGPILAVTPCVAPPSGLLLHIGLPRSGDFLYIPGTSRLFSFYSLRPGAWTLGLAGPDLLGCFVSARRGLRLAGRGGPIIMIGTSF